MQFHSRAQPPTSVHQQLRSMTVGPQHLRADADRSIIEIGTAYVRGSNLRAPREGLRRA